MNSTKHLFKTFCGSLTKSGLCSLCWSVVSMTVHAEVPSQSSESQSQYQDFRAKVFWNKDALWTVVPMTVRPTCCRG